MLFATFQELESHFHRVHRKKQQSPLTAAEKCQLTPAEKWQTPAAKKCQTPAAEKTCQTPEAEKTFQTPATKKTCQPPAAKKTCQTSVDSRSGDANPDNVDRNVDNILTGSHNTPAIKSTGEVEYIQMKKLGDLVKLSEVPSSESSPVKLFSESDPVKLSAKLSDRDDLISRLEKTNVKTRSGRKTKAPVNYNQGD